MKDGTYIMDIPLMGSKNMKVTTSPRWTRFKYFIQYQPLGKLSINGLVDAAKKFVGMPS